MTSFPTNQLWYFRCGIGLWVITMAEVSRAHDCLILHESHKPVRPLIRTALLAALSKFAIYWN